MGFCGLGDYINCLAKRGRKENLFYFKLKYIIIDLSFGKVEIE
jgi:hypothetical protein